MTVSIIVAMANQQVIGFNNRMPWHLPADLQHFKRTTLHKPIVMGRKTFESIGRPLPQRRNIVVSRQKGLVLAGVETFSSVTSALGVLRDQLEVMIIGGQEIFEQTLSIADRLYITYIDFDTEGDVFFPSWVVQEWTLIKRECHPPDANNPYPYTFAEYQRNTG